MYIDYELEKTTLALSTITTKKGVDYEIARLYNEDKTFCLVSFINTFDSVDGERKFASSISDAEVAYTAFEAVFEPAALRADEAYRKGENLQTSRNGTEYGLSDDEETDIEFRVFPSGRTEGNTTLFFTFGASWGDLSGLSGRFVVGEQARGRRVFTRVRDGFVPLGASFVQTTQVQVPGKDGAAPQTRYVPLNYTRINEARGILSNALALAKTNQLLAEENA